MVASFGFCICLWPPGGVGGWIAGQGADTVVAAVAVVVIVILLLFIVTQTNITLLQPHRDMANTVGTVDRK